VIRMALNRAMNKYKINTGSKIPKNFYLVSTMTYIGMDRFQTLVFQLKKFFE
jgi:hypothetical protein